MSFWTDDRVQALTTAWARGDSAGQIARDLTGISRNGVIGKVHRLGLTRRQQRKVAGPRQRTVRVPKLHHALHHTPPIPRSELPKPTIDDTKIPKRQRKQLLDLGHHDCRWPVGEVGSESFFFCGGLTMDGTSYCRAHYRASRR